MLCATTSTCGAATVFARKSPKRRPSSSILGLGRVCWPDWAQLSKKYTCGAPSALRKSSRDPNVSRELADGVQAPRKAQPTSYPFTSTTGGLVLCAASGKTRKENSRQKQVFRIPLHMFFSLVWVGSQRHLQISMPLAAESAEEEK